MDGVIFGCWDLFHEGHLNALEQCSYFVNTLYVGIFSDKVILKYKGKLPTISEQQRLKIVQHINLQGCKIRAYLVTERIAKNRSEDFVFVSETLENKELKMVDKKIYKGTIIFIHYTPKVSTSAIRHRILFEDY